jgi:hypothetical protein
MQVRLIRKHEFMLLVKLEFSCQCRKCKVDRSDRKLSSEAFVSLRTRTEHFISTS